MEATTEVKVSQIDKVKEILTGSGGLTAEQIARQLGLITDDSTKAEVSKAAKKARVLARKAVGGKATSHSGRNAVYSLQ